MEKYRQPATPLDFLAPSSRFLHHLARTFHAQVLKALYELNTHIPRGWSMGPFGGSSETTGAIKIEVAHRAIIYYISIS